jgi:hypothetical protein
MLLLIWFGGQKNRKKKTNCSKTFKKTARRGPSIMLSHLQMDITKCPIKLRNSPGSVGK